MSQISITKKIINKNNKQIEVFVVPAMSFNQADGTIKTFPHPHGNNSLTFESLEKAINSIAISGYDYITAESSTNITANTDTKPNFKLAIIELIKLLNDKSPEVIASAAYALGEMATPLALDSLIALLGNDEHNIRKNTIEALAKIGTPSIKKLINALEDSNWVKRNSAAIALGELTDYNKHLNVTPAVNPLIARLQDNQPIVKSTAARSLGKIYKKITEQRDFQSF
ncbi:MAG: HEAT repeat domain-containing protein [bacterium]